MTVGPPPIQDPLEIWLGGNGPKGLALTGTHADGWLGSRATPAQAEASRRTIEATAAAAGRTIDDDHFGISIPYARTDLDDRIVSAIMRKTDAERADILPFGSDELAALLRRHIDAGITKFVLRPMTLHEGWDTELDYLAEHRAAATELRPPGSRRRSATTAARWRNQGCLPTAQHCRLRA